MGRKFQMACIGIGALTLAVLLGQWSPGFAALFPSFVGGVVGLVTVFVTGHAYTDVSALKKKD